MADELGRCKGKTLLAQLMPYPRRRADKALWPYRKYHRFDDYESYRDYMLPKRLALLRSVFEMPCDRKLVVAYGKSDWPDFKKLFEAYWSQVKPFELGLIGEMAVVLTPQLSTRAFNSENELDHFASVVTSAIGQVSTPARGRLF
jgi:hypothetical protein